MNKYIWLLLLLTASMAGYSVRSWAYSAPRETEVVQSDRQEDSDDSYDSDAGGDDEDDNDNRGNNLDNADGPDEGPIIGDEDNRPKER